MVQLTKRVGKLTRKVVVINTPAYFSRAFGANKKVL
jgi:hypothetical protein